MAAIKRRSNALLFALHNKPGVIGQYATRTDDDAAYQFEYESGWIDITDTQGFIIIPKRIEALLLLGQNTTVNIKWAFDFSSIFKSKQVTFDQVAAFAEWGDLSGEWGNASGIGGPGFGGPGSEWGGGASLHEAKVAATGTGEYIKLGLSATIDIGTVAIQQMDINAKIGRLK